MAIAQIYNYFNDYELPYNDGSIATADFMRACQEGSLPHVYNSMVIQRLVEDMDDSMNFFGFVQTVYSYRLWVNADKSPRKNDGTDNITMD